MERTRLGISLRNRVTNKEPRRKTKVVDVIQRAAMDDNIQWRSRESNRMYRKSSKKVRWRHQTNSRERFAPDNLGQKDMEGIGRSLHSRLLLATLSEKTVNPLLLHSFSHCLVKLIVLCLNYAFLLLVKCTFLLPFLKFFCDTFLFSRIGRLEHIYRVGKDAIKWR